MGLVAEVRGLSDLELDARRRSIERRRRELEAEQAVVLAESDQRNRYAVDGHATMWGLLRAELGWSSGECRTRMRVARLVESFAYYLNPFEWWAYSRDDHWPPSGKLDGVGWRRPIVRSFASRADRSGGAPI